MNDVPLASKLEGKTIKNWQVLKKREKTPQDRSGAFSSCYEVNNTITGQIGFLKAFNYKYAFEAVRMGQSSTDVMEELSSSFNYERDLLSFCREQDRKSGV